jgi:cullin 3
MSGRLAKVCVRLCGHLYLFSRWWGDWPALRIICVLQFKIEPFRHPLKLDPEYPEKTWRLLENAIHEINNDNSSGLSFEELHRNAYNMVVNKYGPRLYNGLQKTTEEHLSKIADKIEQLNGEAMLKSLEYEYEKHKKSFSIIREIFMHLDKSNAKQRQFKSVHELGLDLWRTCVIRRPVIMSRVMETLLKMIENERNGEITDTMLTRSIIVMFIDLGAEVYIKDFESQFLEATKNYYEKEAAELIDSMSCPEYLGHAERRLKEESDRVTAYLHPTSAPKLAEVVENKVVACHSQTLITSPSGAISILEQGDYANLKRMYKLFVRVKCDDVLKTAISNHIKELGLRIVDDNEKSQDATALICSLLDLRKKCDEMLSEGLNSDKNFNHALNNAFEYFVNKNPRSPEYISLFIDSKLRKGAKGVSEEELEESLENAITLFRYISEKDLFEKYYKQHLAKRLLNGKSSSDDSERSLLGKLKVECGYQFTAKLESMFNDIRTSRETMVEFKNWMEESQRSPLGVDLSVQVLTTGAWPAAGQQGACNLPRELDSCCELFKDYYDHAHSGRKLAWQSSMGTAEIRANFGKKKHEISCSTHQMVVLMLLNDTESLTYQELLESSGIPDPELKRVMQSMTLVKGKNILKKSPEGRDIQLSDNFSVNESFTSKLYKVKIGTSTAVKENEFERIETREKVEEDRRPQIEAAIVRLMKSRKILQHNDIITEVTRQLSNRFNPSPVAIKRRIESLIEREYMERDANDRNLYRYIA